jgi:hypothetical protein
MAELVPLSDTERRDIARQIGSMLPAAPLGGPPGSGNAPRLGASYPIDILPLAPVAAGASLREAVYATGRWHHQIAAAQSCFARSEAASAPPPSGGAEDIRSAGHIVNALVESRLADLIDRTATWIDAIDKTPDEARLLVAPAYNLTCIRLLGQREDRIVPVEWPHRLARLETEHFYSDDEFMMILRDVPPVRGVPSRED